MNSLTAILVIAVVYAIGDVISNKTKALLSMMFASGLIFLIGFWVGIPVTLFEDSKMVPVAMALISMLMVHMGSFMKLRDLKEEWKTVLIAILALIALSLALYFIGSPLIGRKEAIVAIGPISGGVVATIIVSEAAKAQGLNALAVFATLLLVLQSFIGLPLASFCLKREAARCVAKFREGGSKAEGSKEKKGADPEVPTFKVFPPLPKAFQTPFILLAKALLVAWLAVMVAGLTKNMVHPFVVALLFGIIFYEIGFIEHKILDKANSSGLTLFLMMVPIFMSLSKATPQMVASLIVPTIVAFVISVFGMVLLSLLMSKILKYSWEMALAIGSTCLFGFPGTYIISQEVAGSQSNTPEEKELILKHILPKMLVAGFTTVTIASVILAGFIVKLL
ncbi:MAG: hypothetical protein WCT14_12140 [Treponemataceae bacterium]